MNLNTLLKTEKISKATKPSLQVQEDSAEPSAYDLIKTLKDKKNEFPFLLNNEAIIGTFLACDHFENWTLQDFSSLYQAYSGLLNSDAPINLDFYKKSYSNIFYALEDSENNLIKKQKSLVNLQKNFQKKVDQYDLVNVDVKKVKDQIEALQTEVESIEQNKMLLNNMLMQVDSSLAINIFHLATSNNFVQSVVDFLLEENNFEMSPSTIKQFYVAYQNQFHRLDEQTVKYLLQRGDNGIEIMLGNLTNVSPAFFREVIRNEKISLTLRNQFATKVAVKGVSSKKIKDLLTNSEIDPLVRDFISYHKEISPSQCQEFFAIPNLTNHQKIGLLSKVWPNEKEHMFELVQMFRKETFSTLSKNEIESLIQTVWLSLGRHAGINPPVCLFKNKADEMGSWNAFLTDFQKSQSVDAINAGGWFSISLNNFDQYKDDKGIKILSTVIHEMEHAKQSKLVHLPSDKKTPEEKNLSDAYALTFQLLPFSNVIFFSTIAPMFVKDYEDLVQKYNDPYFYKRKDFDYEPYFSSKRDMTMFLETYKHAGISQMASEMGVAKDIIDSLIFNNLKNEFNVMFDVVNPYHIYLNFTVELGARKAAIDFSRDAIALFKERKEDTKDLQDLHRILVTAENEIEYYGVHLEHAILKIAVEMQKAGILFHENPKVEESIKEYISARQNANIITIESSPKLEEPQKDFILSTKKKKTKQITAKSNVGGKEYDNQ